MDYDGSLTHDEPVNQVPLLLDFRSHAATFAHQLDDAMGHHSLTSSSEEDRLTTFQVLSAMLGSAWPEGTRYGRPPTPRN